MFELPTGYTLFSQSGDSVTYRHSASTPAEPRLIIIDRKLATFDQKTSTWSVPSYRVRVIRGLVDGDGAPRAERLLMDATFRTPIGAEEAFTTQVFPDVLSLFEATGFAQSVIAQDLPMCCPSE